MGILLLFLSKISWKAETWEYNCLGNMSIQLLGEHEYTSAWETWEYNCLVNMRIQLFGKHENTTAWEPWVYICLGNIRIQLLGEHENTTAWETWEYNCLGNMRIQLLGKHENTTEVWWKWCRCKCWGNISMTENTLDFLISLRVALAWNNWSAWTWLSGAVLWGWSIDVATKPTIIGPLRLVFVLLTMLILPGMYLSMCLTNILPQLKARIGDLCVTVCYCDRHTVESFLHSGNGMQEDSGVPAQNLLEWIPDTSEVSSSIFNVC